MIINCTAVQLMIFPKQTKMSEIYLNAKETTLEKLKAKALNENPNKSIKFWLKLCQDWVLAKEYDVDIKNHPAQGLDFVMLIIKK